MKRLIALAVLLSFPLSATCLHKNDFRLFGVARADFVWVRADEEENIPTYDAVARECARTAMPIRILREVPHDEWENERREAARQGQRLCKVRPGDVRFEVGVNEIVYTSPAADRFRHPEGKPSGQVDPDWTWDGQTKSWFRHCKPDLPQAAPTNSSQRFPAQQNFVPSYAPTFIPYRGGSGGYRSSGRC